MAYYLTLINFSKTMHAIATPFPSIEAAMDHACNMPKGWIHDAWIKEGSDVKADFAKIKAHCPDHFSN